ncbi:MAG TPA: glutamate--tRNA ligase, partial [Candidatus Krumholzibacteriaceae bacterium]|nr:glutamate--tRNA ligase [Candidatus Krumholzibacteriaceae bacterium]
EEERRIKDIIRGEVVFPPGMVGDFVILRSNGLPTYNFAAAVDDALMKITHVIRGEEHLSNTLRQIMIYGALGMDIPEFAHIPLILGSDRSKLSKRHGAPNVKDYRRKGYPPDAVVNYLAMLGWSSPDQREILGTESLIKEFTLERVSESPSIFDVTKLDWVSAQTIRAGKAERYLESALNYFPEYFKERYKRSEIEKIFNLISENMSHFCQIETLILPFSPRKVEFSPEALETLAESGELIGYLIEGVENIPEWTGENVRNVIKSSGKRAGVKGKDLYKPLRVALTGEEHGPDLSSIIMIKGKEDVLDSLKHAYSESSG